MDHVVVHHSGSLDLDLIRSDGLEGGSRFDTIHVYTPDFRAGHIGGDTCHHLFGLRKSGVCMSIIPILHPPA